MYEGVVKPQLTCEWIPEELHLDPGYEELQVNEVDKALKQLYIDIKTATHRHIPKKQHKIHIDFRPSIRTQRLTTCYRTRFEQNRQNHIPVYRDLNILRTHILNSLQEDHPM